MQKRRVLIVSHECVNPLSQQLYAEVQAVTGWHFTLLTPALWKDEFGNSLSPELLPGFDADPVAVPVSLNGNIILHFYRFNFRRFLSKRKFDLIYVNHEPYALSTAQVCWANLQTLRVPFGFHSCQNIYKRYPVPFSRLERMVYRSSKFAFPITDAVAQVLREKGFTGEATLCPFPFDPKLYHRLSTGERLETIPRASDEIILGYVGRMVEQKGLKTLIEAVAGLPRSGWKLVMIGTGPYEAALEDLIMQHNLANQVTRLGYVAHHIAPRYLGALDVLVLPSETRPNWKEQFGRVLVEAMACGVCVVGSDSGEIPSLIRASGGGRIFPETNATALTAILRQMIEDANQRQKYAEVGHTWANKNISIPAVAASVAGAMESAMAVS